MLVQFLGHACFQITTGDNRILIDPYLTGNPKAAVKAAEVNTDWILVTHGHSDHLGDAVEIAHRTGATIVTISEVARYCSNLGAKSHAMYIGGKRDFGAFTVKLTMALHGSSLGIDPIQYLGQPCGFLVFAEGKTIYYTGDTGLFGDMALIGRLHPVDLLVLPIGDNYTMGPEDALEAVRLVNPKQVVPMHYNTWEIITQDPAKFKKEVEQATGVPVSVLTPGQSIEL